MGANDRSRKKRLTGKTKKRAAEKGQRGKARGRGGRGMAPARDLVEVAEEVRWARRCATDVRLHAPKDLSARCARWQDGMSNKAG